MAQIKQRLKKVKSNPCEKNSDQGNISKLKTNKRQFQHTKLNSRKATASQNIWEGISILLRTIFILSILLILAIHVRLESNAVKIARGTTKSSILYEYSEAVLEFTEAMEKFNEALNEETLVDLIKLQLRPIQERVASLRTQTSIYEKMTVKISGGPKSFILSTTTELDTLTEKILSLYTSVENSLIQSILRRTEFIDSMEKAFSRKKRLNDMYKSTNRRFFHSLVKQGLQLIPINNTLGMELKRQKIKFSRSEIQLKKSGMSPEKLACKLRALSKLYEQREQSNKLILSSLGFFSWQEVHNDPASSIKLETDPFLVNLDNEITIIDEKIAEAIETNGQFFNLTVRYILETLFILNNNYKSVTKFEAQNGPYLDLKNIVVEDIHMLKTRVQNLYYS